MSRARADGMGYLLSYLPSFYSWKERAGRIGALSLGLGLGRGGWYGGALPVVHRSLNFRKTTPWRCRLPSSWTPWQWTRCLVWSHERMHPLPLVRLWMHPRSSEDPPATSPAPSAPTPIRVMYYNRGSWTWVTSWGAWLVYAFPSLLRRQDHALLDVPGLPVSPEYERLPVDPMAVSMRVALRLPLPRPGPLVSLPSSHACRWVAEMGSHTNPAAGCRYELLQKPSTTMS